MTLSPRRPPRRLPIVVLSSFVFALALFGIAFLAARERGRMRLSAEYEAFRVASELLAALDGGGAWEGAEGLVGFGVYARRGTAVFRWGAAPAELDPAALDAPPRLEGGVLSFARTVGMQAGMPGMQGGGNGGPGMGRRMARSVFVALDAAALRRDEAQVLLAAGFVAAALVAAWIALAVLARGLDARREQAARDRELVALGQASRTLAHEIKNPLGIVKIQCALLRRSSDPAVAPGVAVIEEEVDRLASLTGRVRDLLAAGEGDPEVVDVAAFLESTAKRYAGPEGSPVVVAERPPAGASVRVDPARLDQIVSNLIANALEATSSPAAAPVELSARRARGTVSIRVADRGPGVDPARLDQIVSNLIANALEATSSPAAAPVELSARRARGTVSIRVADRGPGVDPAAADRIFDPFFTTKPSGSGIGLAIARRYAEAAGGSLRWEPRPGGGAVFALELPAADGGLA